MFQQNMNGMNMNMNQNMHQQNMNFNSNKNYFNNNQMDLKKLFNMFVLWMNNKGNFNNINMNNLNNNNMNMFNMNNNMNNIINNNMNNNINNNMNNFMTNNIINNNNYNNPSINKININNNFNNNMNNNFNMGNNNSNQNEGEYKGILPRSEIPLIVDNEFPYEEGQTMANIVFLAGTGFRVVVNTPTSITMKELFLLYTKKTGIGPNSLEKDIIFLFDAEILKPDDQRKIYEVFPGRNPTITVIDRGNVLGAKA